MHTPYCDMADEARERREYEEMRDRAIATGRTIVTTVQSGTDDRRRHYGEDLFRRQQEHLRQVQRNRDSNWQPCLHDQCPECVGTGIKKDGTHCVHMISCPCPKCTPRC